MKCTNGFVQHCINIEPELPEEMPNELWKQMKILVQKDDKEGMNEILRHVVKQTKKGILARINQGIVSI